MGLALLVLAGGPVATQGQTPTRTITNGNGDVRLQLNADGGFYVPGVFGPSSPADSIPATGAGTRLMWYPAKAAFRAGRVGVRDGNGSFWDADSIGQFSVALGADTKASGTGAAALGGGTTASGPAATAMGQGATASGDNATAMGFQTTASGNEATAMGNETTASGSGATAMGLRTAASGLNATAMGLETTAATDQSLSIGQYNSANTSDDGALFVVGNGNLNNRSDALVLDDQGNLEIAGTLTEDSDRRLKTGIEPLGDGTLEALSALRPVRYRFKDQQTHPSGEQIGLVAQDVRKEFPELVRETADGMLSLAYPKLTAVLLKGMQEQQSTIDSLEQKVQQVESLRKRVARLEQQSSTGSIVAGLPAQGFLAVLLVLGGLGGGLLWRRR